MRYMELPCVEWVRAGAVEKGSRRRAALILALAARIDGRARNEAEDHIKAYYKALNTSDFTIDEVLRAVTWAYGLETTAWSCDMAKAFNLCRPEGCPFMEIKYTDNDMVEVTRPNGEHVKLPSTEAMLREVRKLSPDVHIRTEVIKHDGKSAVVKAIYENNGTHLEAVADAVTGEDQNGKDALTVASRRAIAKVLRYAGVGRTEETDGDDGSILAIFTVNPPEFEAIERIKKAKMAVEYDKYTRVR